MSKRAPHINLLDLTSEQFEELCVELLSRLGYQNLEWRRGGADDGRDIQGTKHLNSGLGESLQETWFFECKLSQRGVSAGCLNSKLAWADAARPAHFMFLVGSYLSNSARRWLDELRPTKPYSIHVVEGKGLEHLIARYPDLIEKYFEISHPRMLRHAQSLWVEQQTVPPLGHLFVLASRGSEKYSPTQLAFLWCWAKLGYSNADDVAKPSTGDHAVAEDSFEPVGEALVRSSRSSAAALCKYKKLQVNSLSTRHTNAPVRFNRIFAARLRCMSANTWNECLYVIAHSADDDEGLEVLVADNAESRVRYIAMGARDACAEATRMILEDKVDRQWLRGAT